jgi:hypothetical protein
LVAIGIRATASVLAAGAPYTGTAISSGTGGIVIAETIAVLIVPLKWVVREHIPLVDDPIAIGIRD